MVSGESTASRPFRFTHQGSDWRARILLANSLPTQANLTSSPIYAEVDQITHAIIPAAPLIHRDKLAETFVGPPCIVLRLDLNRLCSPLSLPA